MTSEQTAALMQSPIGRNLLNQITSGVSDSSPLSALLGQVQAGAMESGAPNGAAAQPSFAETHSPTAPSSAAASASTHAPVAMGITEITNAAQLAAVKSEPCAVVLFTSPTCPPCRIVEPEYEQLAHSGLPVTFARVTAGSEGASAAMSAANIAGTPTVHVYTFGECTAKVLGPDIPEIRLQAHIGADDVYPSAFVLTSPSSRQVATVVA